MKFRRSSTTGKMLTGASRIVAAPSMSGTRAAMAKGSVASDWKNIGNDIRGAMKRARDELAEVG